MKNKFKFLFFSIKIFLFIQLLNGFWQPVFAQNIYVSPQGNDLNSGTKNDPVATLNFAKELAYAQLKEKSESFVTIWLSEGIHQLKKPLEFKPLPSADSTATVLVKAVPGEKPVVSGGIRLTVWQKNNDFWEATIPENMQNKQVRELFINNRRATRARFPNDGWLRVDTVGIDRRTNFQYKKGDFPVPADLAGVELVLLHDWSISRIGIKEINREENRITAVDSIGAKNPEFFNLDHWEPNPRYFLENAPEFLDSSYEWVSIPAENKIRLKLPETENPDNLEIFIPFSEGLISMEGDENQPVRNIHFDGITFRHSAWEIPEKGYCGVQACHFDPRPAGSEWSVVPAAVRADWAEDCTFSNCVFENLGGSGLWLGTGCRNCRIENSAFNDISGNGVMIGEGRDRETDGEKWWKVAPDQAARGNSINQCEIANCGRQFFGAVGIWCGLTVETIIRSNEISQLPYTGVSIGWMWSPEPTPCRGNILQGNHIHDVMQVLSDGGGIYMLGLQPGSKILNNHIHDVKVNAGRAESNGMFLDEGTTDVVIAGNLIYNIAKSPLRFHKATQNLVENNYLFCRNNNPPVRYNNTKAEDIKMVENKVFDENDANYEEELQQAIEKWGNAGLVE